MKELRDKQKFKKTLYSLPVLLLAALLVVFLGRGAGSVLMKERESARTLEVLTEKNEALKERHEELKQDVAKLHTEEGIAEEIRSKFNVTRPGEHLAIVVGAEVRAATATPSALTRGWAWFLGLWGL
jgi:cell division protein FtsB